MRLCKILCLFYNHYALAENFEKNNHGKKKHYRKESTWIGNGRCLLLTIKSYEQGWGLKYWSNSYMYMLTFPNASNYIAKMTKSKALVSKSPKKPHIKFDSHTLSIWLSILYWRVTFVVSPLTWWDECYVGRLIGSQKQYGNNGPSIDFKDDQHYWKDIFVKENFCANNLCQCLNYEFHYLCDSCLVKIHY